MPSRARLMGATNRVMHHVYRLRTLGYSLFGLTGTLLALAYLLALLLPVPLLQTWYRLVSPFLALTMVATLLLLLLPRGPRASEPRAAAVDPPLPGPAARVGRMLALLRLAVTQVLVLFNPFQLVQVVAQIGGQLFATLRRPPPAHPDPAATQVRYRLPFAGRWYVYNGGVTPQTSHSWDVVAQRYAYDFVIADDQLQRHSDRGDRLADYYCYDQPILAAAAGEVVAVRDGIRDAPWVGSFAIDWLCRDFRGNFVVIKHAPREYSVSAHLVPGSITVEVGDQVQPGQQIGRCGNSGHSTEPHLHFQLQDHPNFWLAVGLPVQFTPVSSASAPAAPGYLTRGTHVEALP